MSKFKGYLILSLARNRLALKVVLSLPLYSIRSIAVAAQLLCTALQGFHASESS